MTSIFIPRAPFKKNERARFFCYYKNMAKLVKYTVAIVLKKSVSSDEFLVVQRPEDDPDLRGHWGLPAITLRSGELPTDGAVRVCREKLGCDGTPARFLGIMFQKRNTYDIFLMDIEVILKEGTMPDVQKAITEGTRYVEQKWTTDPNDLMVSATSGSCCSSIFLTDRGLLDRDKWVQSLEGSDIVG
jgi:ADP-ribose pyrophosphatase YjhB (NUDIX family)